MLCGYPVFLVISHAMWITLYKYIPGKTINSVNMTKPIKILKLNIFKNHDVEYCIRK